MPWNTTGFSIEAIIEASPAVAGKQNRLLEGLLLSSPSTS
jgi:phage tail protein X